jgi:hypothetical protein
MEQAATLVTHRRSVLPISASVRLRQGSSARATWILQEAPGGTTIRVGADSTCDWQIRAAFVPPQAFSLRLLDGEVRVQAGRDQSVLLNGKLLGEGWVAVPSGARIDVGLARVEVTTGYDTGSFASPQLRAATFVTGGSEPPRRVSHPPLFEALPASDPQESDRQLHAMLGWAPPEESGEFEVHRRRDSSPALLDNDRSSDKGALRRYALMGVATACAYGGWLALLDHL